MLQTDCQLLYLIAQQNKEAFEILYRRYWRLGFDAAFQRLKDRQQAEDIIQEIFTALWLRKKALQIDNFQAYLYTAIRNKVLNFVTRNKITDTFYEPLIALMVEADTADTALLQKELLHRFREYIKALPEKRRKVFILHLNKNLSTNEIAEQCRISPKTVQNQIYTVMEGLRSHVIPILLAIFLLAIGED